MACKSAFIMHGELSIQAGACCGLMKVAEPRGHVMNFHWSLQNFNLLQKTSHAMDDEPRVRRQRAGLLVGCATLPMSEPHRHPHGRLRKLKNRLKTSRSAREPHRAATSLAMARPAPALTHLGSVSVHFGADLRDIMVR